jgi:outer membrane lipoprotein-sorting protein
MVLFGLLIPLCLGAQEAAQEAAQDADLLTTVWNGVQRAQKENTSSCGKIVETRTSVLLARPMVFRGKFCAAGLDRFALEYTEPEPVRILFNKDYLNVTTDGGRKTEVMDVGGNVRRTQAYFSRDNSLANLKKNFEIAVSREPGMYVMRMTPRTESFRRKIVRIVVKLDAAKFLLRSLEVAGKSGVTSVFRVETTSLNSRIPDGTFDVYRPK